MTVKERILTIRLFLNLQRYQNFANQAGIIKPQTESKSKKAKENESQNQTIQEVFAEIIETHESMNVIMER